MEAYAGLDVRKTAVLQKLFFCKSCYLSVKSTTNSLMLDQLLKLVEQNAQQPIVQNKAIPDQFNNAAIKEVANQIFNSLKGQVDQGNIQQIVTMFQGGAGRSIGSNPVVNNIITSVAGSLATKFNIPSQEAQSVAANLVPGVITQVIKKANDPRDIDFDLQQMMRGMSGNQSLDITDMMGQAPKSTIGNVGNILGKLFGK